MDGINSDALLDNQGAAKEVTRYTRAGKDGKLIVCPACRAIAMVYHFSWSGLKCKECKAYVAKPAWLISKWNKAPGKTGKYE